MSQAQTHRSAQTLTVVVSLSPARWAASLHAQSAKPPVWGGSVLLPAAAVAPSPSRQREQWESTMEVVPAPCVGICQMFDMTSSET